MQLTKEVNNRLPDSDSKTTLNYSLIILSQSMTTTCFHQLDRPVAPLLFLPITLSINSKNQPADTLMKEGKIKKRKKEGEAREDKEKEGEEEEKEGEEEGRRTTLASW